VTIASAFGSFVNGVYEAQSGHWIVVLLLSILSGIFCSIFPLLLFFIAEIKNRMMESGIIFGLIGGFVIQIIFGFAHNSELLAGVFIGSTLFGVFAVKDAYRD